MLEDEDALPRSERHPALRHRDDFARPRQHHAQMRRHVVAPLVGVDEVILILRHEALEEFVQVRARGRIGVFIDDERGAGVLDEDGRGARGHAALAHDARDFIGDLVGAFATRADGEGGGVCAYRGILIMAAASVQAMKTIACASVGQIPRKESVLWPYTTADRLTYTRVDPATFIGSPMLKWSGLGAFETPTNQHRKY